MDDTHNPADDTAEDGAVPPTEGEGAHDAGSVGTRLRAAREEQGLSRGEIAERTKIAERHLESIEDGRLSDLPGRTYAIGFVRSYARALGLDDKSFVDAARDEIGATAPAPPPRTLNTMEPGDPARVPSSKLAWGVLALLIVLVAIGAFAWRGFFLPAADLPPLAADEVVTEPTAAPPTAAPSEAAVPEGAVTFTATVEGIWVKFYNRNGRDLFQKQMAQGESFTIPEDADGPQLWTGRPDALTITIGGREVPPLATEQRTIRDVPVDAASLTARPAGPGTPAR